MHLYRFKLSQPVANNIITLNDDSSGFPVNFTATFDVYGFGVFNNNPGTLSDVLKRLPLEYDEGCGSFGAFYFEELMICANSESGGGTYNTQRLLFFFLMRNQLMIFATYF